VTLHKPLLWPVTLSGGRCLTPRRSLLVDDVVAMVKKLVNITKDIALFMSL
jgi:hypothetical protein